MESAHLTKAHEHVRNAVTATYGNSIATAGQEHELAATAFHEATQDTQNVEALRILGLLEDHHHKLAGLIKEAPRKRERKSEATSQPPRVASPPPKLPVSRTASPSASSPTRAPSRRRLPQSSIASNLAEKRGIPGARRGTPTSAPVSITNALATRNDRPSTPVRDMLERQSRKTETSRQGEAPQLSKAEEKTAITTPLASPPAEDNFRRFYSAFGGVISAISAPLAFTSLPLNPRPATPAADPPDAKDEKTTKTKSRAHSPEASRTVKSSEPDLAALISKPALRALREDNNTPLGHPNESFYLVPTSGGTVSYASILQNPNAPHHPHHAAQDPRLDSIDEGDNESGGGGSGLRSSSHEEFVDARESVGPPSPTLARRPRSRGKQNIPGGGVTTARNIAAGRGTGLKTMEELALENETLKQLVDKQAKRLSMWETTSQSSYSALAQSFRARKMPSDPNALAQALSFGSNAVPSLPSPPLQSHRAQSPAAAAATATATATAPVQPDPGTAKRIAELEALLAAQNAKVSELTSSNEQLARQNEKNTQVLGRYREQWEKLKAGARRKEQERREKKLAELKADEAAKESESGDGDAVPEGEEALDTEEAGFGKA